MKTRLSILSLAALAMAGCSSDAGKSIVEGSLVGAEGKKVYMDVRSIGTDGHVSDSATVAPDGSFRLRGIVQHEPTFYDVRLADGRTFTVLLDSAQTLKLKADGTKSLLVGNVAFDESPRNENLQKIMMGASAILSGVHAGANVDSLQSAIKAYKEEVRQIIYSDPQSMVGYFAVLQSVRGSRVFDIMNKQDHNLFGTVATSLQIAYPNSSQVKYLVENVLSARAQQKAIAKRDSIMQNATQVNSPDLNLPDMDGNMVRLSSLRGKTVLLYFWAADEENSRKANQQLASIYKKYSGRNFEIYGVSFTNSRILWESATANDRIEWTNLNGMGSNAAALYNVMALPSNYILAPDGRLIGKDLFGSRLDEKLAEILR